MSFLVEKRRALDVSRGLMVRIALIRFSNFALAYFKYLTLLTIVWGSSVASTT